MASFLCLIYDIKDVVQSYHCLNNIASFIPIRQYISFVDISTIPVVYLKQIFYSSYQTRTHMLNQ